MKPTLGVVIPVHYPPEVTESAIRSALEETLAGQDAYCRPGRCVLVVDSGSPAERVIDSACQGSPIHGTRVSRLRRNRGKAGSVRRGLEHLLEQHGARWILTRDCDGDHLIDDVPRFLRLAEELEGHSEAFSIFGARSSYAHSMGWRRQEWERLTNRLFIDCTAYLAAQRGRVLDRRFWNRRPLDLQSGYRLYSLAGARAAARSLGELPDDPEVYTFACEMVPFLELSLQGGLVAQIPCTTRMGQSFSNYASLDLPRRYGSLFAHLARTRDLPGDILASLLDNALADSDLFHSEHRESTLAFRRSAASQAAEFLPPRHV